MKEKERRGEKERKRRGKERKGKEKRKEGRDGERDEGIGRKELKGRLIDDYNNSSSSS